MSPATRVRLLPVAVFVVALLATVSIRPGSPPAATPPETAAKAPALVRQPSPEPPRLQLATVRELPAPLATPKPRLSEPAAPAPPVFRPAEPTATATPFPTAAPVVPVAPQPTSAPAPAPEPAPPAPTPAPRFDDSGSGPEFDDDGVSP